jgi:hypothetical protein
MVAKNCNSESLNFINILKEEETEENGVPQEVVKTSYNE